MLFSLRTTVYQKWNSEHPCKLCVLMTRFSRRYVRQRRMIQEHLTRIANERAPDCRRNALMVSVTDCNLGELVSVEKVPRGVAMSTSQTNKRSNRSIVAALSLISLFDLTVCSSSSDGNANTRDGGTGGSKGISVVPSMGGSGGTSTAPLSSTVTNGTTFFDSEPACLCPPSRSSCATRLLAIINMPLDAVNQGVPGYQYCYLEDASNYTCWNCVDAG